MTNDKSSFLPRRQVMAKASKKRTPRSFWLKTLKDFSESGLSVQKFCHLKNLSPSSFYTWRKLLRNENGEESTASTTFIPLEVMAADNSRVPSKKDPQNQQVPFFPVMEKAKQDTGLSLHLNNGLKISIDQKFHEPTLQRLVHLFSSGNISTC